MAPGGQLEGLRRQVSGACGQLTLANLILKGAGSTHPTLLLPRPSTPDHKDTGLDVLARLFNLAPSICRSRH